MFEYTNLQIETNFQHISAFLLYYCFNLTCTYSNYFHILSYLQIIGSLFVLSVSARPDAEPQFYRKGIDHTSGFVRYTNGAIVPDDTASVKAVKVIYLLLTLIPTLQVTIKESRILSCLKWIVPLITPFIDIQNSGLTHIIGSSSHGSQLLRNLPESFSAIQ